MLTTEWWWVGNIDENKERDFFNSNARTHKQTMKRNDKEREMTI